MRAGMRPLSNWPSCGSWWQVLQPWKRPKCSSTVAKLRARSSFSGRAGWQALHSSCACAPAIAKPVQWPWSKSGVSAKPDLALRSVGSGGETLGGELLEWGRETLGVTINEFYGQTECNLIVSNSAGLFPVRAGSMGRPVFGHDVAVIDEGGQAVGPGTVGEVAVRRPDPVMFLRYWNQPEATAAKFTGDWMRTGDQARVDDDGYLWFQARTDDVITSGGYRIGPGEIEDCLLRHPSVGMVAVIGVPDPVRTEIVKAFVVPGPGVEPSERLTAELQAHVRERLAAHEYPRQIEYVDALPLTATGKVMRRELRARS